MVRALPQLNRRVESLLSSADAPALRLRVGIHSGPVVLAPRRVGDHVEHIAHGETLNVAARLQGSAAPGTVEVSARTRELVEGRFVLRSVGRRALKGMAEPFEVWSVVGPSSATSRIEAAASRGLTPLVGREQEVELLLDRWERLREGGGQVVLVEADAGVGKSRLVHTLRERLAGEPHLWLEARCAPEHETSAFRPAADLLARACGIGADDRADAKLERLVQTLLRAGVAPGEGVPAVAPLLGLPLPEDYPPAPSSADMRRRRTLESLASWLLGLARGGRVVGVVEDLHWVDPSTLELLGLVVEQIARAPLLLLLTARPDFRSPWPRRPDLLELALHPLTRAQTRTMVAEVAGARTLDAPTVDEIAARTDGVPLFVEELTRAVLDSDLLVAGEARARPPDIPSTLQGFLMARLDRLGEPKQVVQVAAVVGREFPVELLGAVVPYAPAFLDRALRRIVDAGLLVPGGADDRPTYAFKHALIQDAAYRSLLRGVRQELHAKVAAVLRERFPETVAAEPERMARHYDEAGDLEAAVRFYQRAGEQAKSRSASAEAIRHASRALELVAALPATPERDRIELELRTSLGVLLMANRGSSEATVEAIYARIRELGEKIGEGPSLAHALFGLSIFHQARGELDRSQQMGEALLALAPRLADDSVEASAHLALGVPAFWRGDTARALTHLLAMVARYDPVRHRALAYVYGQDPGVYSRAFAALALHAMGRPEQALRTSEAAVSHSGDEITRAFALSFAGVLHWLRREPEPVRERAEEVIRISEEESFPLWRGAGLVLCGWEAAVAHGDGRALERMREGIAQLTATGTDVAAPLRLAIYADAVHAVGEREEALAALGSALAESERTGSRFLEAELERERGEILLELGRAGEGEAALRRAVAIARAQGAAAYELHAAARLARATAGGPDADAGRALLEEACARLDRTVDPVVLREVASAAPVSTGVP
jgi:predicted ATPase